MNNNILFQGERYMKNKIKIGNISKRTFIICILMLLFTSISFCSSYIMGNTAKDMYEHPYKVTNVSRAMRSRLFDMKRFVNIFLTSNHNENEINQLFEERYEMQNKAIDELYDLYLGSDDDIDSLKNAMNDLISVQEDAIEFASVHTNQEILNYIDTNVYPSYDEVDTNLSIIIESSDSRIYKMTKRVHFTSYGFIIGSVFFAFLIIALSIYMDRMNYKQIKILSDREEKLEYALLSARNANNKKNELEKRLRRENVRLKCVEELYNNHDTKKALNSVLGYIGTLFLAERSYIFLFHDGYCSNTVEWCRNDVLPRINNLQNISLSDYKNWVDLLKKGNKIVINDIENIKNNSPFEYELLSKQNIFNIVLVPLIIDRKIIGIIGLDNQNLNTAEMAAPFLQTIQYFLSLSMQRDKDEKMLLELSQIDKLTSFYNRNRFVKDLSDFEKINGSIGAIFLDVNGLKEINDLNGHYAGDKLLKECANIIKNISSSNNLYRIGGDEFVILYQNIDEELFYDNVVLLKNAFEKSDCHIAIGDCWNKSSNNIQDIVKCADECMYKDKKKYYQGHHVTSRYRHNNDLLGYLANPNILKEKIINNSFKVYLQPKINIGNCSMVGAEALIRYQDENGVIITPDKFIPILENTYLIGKIDYYVFEEVCKILSSWKKKEDKLVTISSNFSRVTFMDDNFVKKIIAITDSYNIQRGILEIEITETASFTNYDTLIARINEIRSAGFKVSIDDFGIENSNLALLSLIQCDILKIDREFVKDISVNKKAQAIVKMVSDMCKEMKIQLVAEGLEDVQQLETLSYFGVEVVQGYLFSKAITISDFEKKYFDK